MGISVAESLPGYGRQIYMDMESCYMVYGLGSIRDVRDVRDVRCNGGKGRS